MGLGLYELRKIPDHIESMAARLATDLGQNASHSFACGLLIYFSVSGFLLGYLATRLILSGEFAKADRDAIRGEARQEAIKVVDEKLAEQVKELDLELIIMTGKIAQQHTTGDHKFLDDTIVKLSKALEKAPAHRRMAMILGTLYKKKGEVEQACRLLENTRQAMVAASSSQGDIADVYFNQACYCSLLAIAAAADAEKMQEWKRKMYVCLDESFKRKPENVKDALGDANGEELRTIRGEPEFQALVLRYSPPA